MFGRLETVEYPKEQKEKYIQHIMYELRTHPHYVTFNDYPYDIQIEGKILKHITVRYRASTWEEKINFVNQVDKRLKQGYIIQINPAKNQSIQEVKHFHALLLE